MKVIALFIVLCLAQSITGCWRAQTLTFGKFKNIGLLTFAYKYMGDMVVDWFQRKFDKNDPFGNYKVLSYKDGGRFEFVHYPFFVLQYDERREIYKPYYFEYIEEEDKTTKKFTRKIGPLTEEEFTTKYNHCKSGDNGRLEQNFVHFDENKFRSCDIV
ncbi:hypothetical protein OSTOST_25199 [Ostertagia ostertagi]